jgi:hypothetical protein
MLCLPTLCAKLGEQPLRQTAAQLLIRFTNAPKAGDEHGAVKDAGEHSGGHQNRVVCDCDR